MLLPLAIQTNLVCRAPFVLELRNIPFAQQRQILWHVIERLPRKRAGKMDARGNGQQIAEETVEHFGSWIEAVMLTEPWYRENMPAFKAAFEDATIELPRDREIRDDIRALKIIRGVARVPEHTKADDGKKRHGDAAIAGALAIAASRAEPEFYGYEGASTRGEQSGATDTGWRDRPDTWAEDHPMPGRGSSRAARRPAASGARAVTLWWIDREPTAGRRGARCARAGADDAALPQHAVAAQSAGERSRPGGGARAPGRTVT